MLRKWFGLAAVIMCSASSFASTQIDHYKMDFWQMLDIEKKEVVNGSMGKVECNNPSLDFFVASDNFCCAAVGCHCGERIGAYYELYFSRVPYVLADFTKPMAVKDTSLFRKADTISNQGSQRILCKNLPSFLEATGMGSRNMIADFVNKFFVVKTNENHYALVKINSFYSNFVVQPGGPLPPVPYVDGVNIMVAFQTDGSLLFDAPKDPTPGLRPIVMQNSSKPVSTTREYFLLDGRKISNPDLHSGILFVKQNGLKKLNFFNPRGIKH